MIGPGLNAVQHSCFAVLDPGANDELHSKPSDYYIASDKIARKDLDVSLAFNANITEYLSG